MKNIFALTFAICLMMSFAGCDDSGVSDTSVVNSNPQIETSRPIIDDVPIIVDDDTDNDNTDDSTSDTTTDTTDPTDTTDTDTDTVDESDETEENLINRLFGNDGISDELINSFRQ
jgi:hypothetical protein